MTHLKWIKQPLEIGDHNLTEFIKYNKALFKENESFVEFQSNDGVAKKSCLILLTK